MGGGWRNPGSLAGSRRQDLIVAEPAGGTPPAGSRRPSFTIRRAYDHAVAARFAGIPLGDEFTSLVLAMLQVGGIPSPAPGDLQQSIRAIDGAGFPDEAERRSRRHPRSPQGRPHRRGGRAARWAGPGHAVDRELRVDPTDRGTAAGGGNSGVEAAINLAGMVEHVTLVEFDTELLADAVLQRTLRSLIRMDVLTTVVLGDGSRVRCGR